MRQTLRLTIRQHRFGFALVGVAAIVFALAAVFIAWLTWGPFKAECWLDPAVSSNLTEAEGLALQARCETMWFVVTAGTNFVLSVSFIVPLAVVLLLAAPMISAELETGTATLAWSLARNRRRWLVPRMGLVMASALALGLAGALASDAIVGQMFTAHPWVSFYGYQTRGGILTAQVLLLASASLFAGALFGRQLPALVVGACLTFGIGVLLTGEDNVLNRANMVLLPGDSSGADFSQDNLNLDSAVQVIATGEILTPEQQSTLDYGSDQFDATYRFVSFGLPAADAPSVMARNVAFYLVPTLLFLGLTFVVVERRRPYLS